MFKIYKCADKPGSAVALSLYAECVTWNDVNILCARLASEQAAEKSSGFYKMCVYDRAGVLRRTAWAGRNSSKKHARYI